jgi:uncharacterized membrane protein YfcA
MTWPALFAFGVAIGIFSGVLGIGGGVLLVPGLVLMFGFSQGEAQGTSLAVMIPPIGLFAAIVYYQHGFIRLPVVGLVAVGFILGAYLGARIVPHVSPAMLKAAFGVLMLFLGFLFVMNPSDRSAHAALPAGIAAVATAVVARVLRRSTTPRSVPPPPDDVHEYHI